MPEQTLHEFAVELLAHCAAPGVIFYHPANGEKREPAIAAKLRRMGVRAGVADLALILPPKGQAAFLELKSSKGRQSPEQEAFEADCASVGALYAVAATPEAVMTQLEAWGAVKRRRAAA